MDQAAKTQLQIQACKVRMGVVEAVYSAKSGHPGGSLSVADTLTYLYNKEMNIDPQNPKAEDRDRLVLSKGHTCPALYSVLANRGYFSLEELKSLRQPGAMLQGHPDMKGTPGVDMSSGSLGQGLSVACGMALAAKLNGKSYRVFTVLGDGEIQEGQVWEAAMFAGAKNLDNMIAIVDNNNLQIDGTVEEVNSPYPIDEKFAAFGWHVININGHSFDEISAALDKAKTLEGKPVVIIQTSVKGKGVSYMENNVAWHGAAPNAEQYEIAMNELKACLAELEG